MLDAGPTTAAASTRLPGNKKLLLLILDKLQKWVSFVLIHLLIFPFLSYIFLSGLFYLTMHMIGLFTGKTLVGYLLNQLIQRR